MVDPYQMFLIGILIIQFSLVIDKTHQPNWS